MRVALVQTRQNELYRFDRPNVPISGDRALALQEEMTQQCLELAEGAVGKGCDLIVTTEAINFCGLESALGTSCAPYISPYPGDELFGKLSGLAARARSWLVAGVYNRRPDGRGRQCCYNSAFIYDRMGRLQGIYDKIHLTESERECLACGHRIVTVDTDMGRMGVAVCYDMQFQDVCGQCREAGAEFMAVPTWGWEHGYGMRRIRETGLAVAAAMAVPYWMPIEGGRVPSELVSGKGKVLARANSDRQELLIGELWLPGCADAVTV